MGYVKNTLAPGEKYLYRAKFNWTYDITGWFWFAVGCAPGALWFYRLFRDYLSVDALSNIFTGLSAVSFAFGLFILLKRYIQKWTTVIAVTTVRLILKTGVIARKAHEVSLDKIEEILVHQSFIGRILGFGHLTIRGTGVAVIEFPILARPMEVRREIETAIVQARAPGQAQAPSPSPTERRRHGNAKFAVPA